MRKVVIKRTASPEAARRWYAQVDAGPLSVNDPAHQRVHEWFATRKEAEEWASEIFLETKKNPVRDPEHKKLVRRLSQHFSTDEAALRRMKKNPVQWHMLEYVTRDGTYVVLYNLQSEGVRTIREANEYLGSHSFKSFKQAHHYSQEEIDRLRMFTPAKRNPSRKHHSAKWRRCVRKVKKKGHAASPYAVCTKAVKNPQGFVLCIRQGGKRLYFDGGKHFTDRKPPKVFKTKELAESEGMYLLSMHDVLSRYKMTVENVPRPK